MSDKIPVSIIITTYDKGDNARFNLLYKTVQALVDNIKYPNLYWIITDDGSPNHDEMVEKIKSIINSDRLIFFNTDRKGVGFAKNNALRKAFETSPYVLMLEDDWELKEEFDLLPHVQLMLDHPDIGMIRLGYLGGEMDAHYTDYGFLKTYWTLLPASGFYVYSGQVSLRSKNFYDIVGYHAEGLQAGQEEENMCWRYNDIKNPPKILWYAQYGTTLNSGLFNNIGLGDSVNAVEPEN